MCNKSIRDLPTKEAHINLDQKKHELIAIIKRCRTNEGLLIQELQELKNEINEIKESLNQMKISYKPHEGMESRTIAIEKCLAKQEQYSRRECRDSWAPTRCQWRRA